MVELSCPTDAFEPRKVREIRIDPAVEISSCPCSFLERCIESRGRAALIGFNSDSPFPVVCCGSVLGSRANLWVRILSMPLFCSHS